MFVYLYDVLLCIGNSVDLISPDVTSHHQQVAFLAYQIGKKMGLDDMVCRNLITAGLLHDIGALNSRERLALIEEEPVTVNSHAFRSARLLEEASPFADITDIVRYHHVKWAGGEGRKYKGKDVPLASQILYLADRTCVKFNTNKNAIEQVPDVLAQISADAGQLFMPKAVDALNELKRHDHIWLELLESSPLDYLPVQRIYGTVSLDIDEMLEVTRMLSFIIDFRSHFTATHSAGVAHTARRLGELFGFSEIECKMMLIAGYLHDLGKLSVPNELLEKPSALNEEEFNIIRGHTFHTFRLLSIIKGFETINKWAAYHHEKLNGKGYPFQLSEDHIPLGSRIMAVADVFTSITEDRPYRKGMSEIQIANVLKSMSENGSLCGIVVDKLINRLSEFTHICDENQKAVASLYENFFQIA